jgi:Putative MetA-pathway of phenol degradation
MKSATSLTLLFVFLCPLGGNCDAQDLAPRAYLITPTHSNAVTFTYSFLDGNIQFDGAVPITGATAKTHVSTLSYYHSFSFFGRSANFTTFLPYGVGNFHGTVVGAETMAYRSGLLAPGFRLSINLIGGRAISPRGFASWRQKTLLGVSFRLVPSAGQYDPTKLVNLGTNRWAFKPELGYSHRSGGWILDAYGGVWFFTENPQFFSHNDFSSAANIQGERPIGSFEGHLSYDFKPRLWVSLDANFWFGGRTSLNGVSSPATVQRNSRVGGSASIPLSAHQSLKFSYNDGAYIRYGGNYQTVSFGWQYSWIGRPN